LDQKWSSACKDDGPPASRSGSKDLEVLCLWIVEAVRRLDAVGHVDRKDEHGDDNGHGQNSGPDSYREKPDVTEGISENIRQRERLHLSFITHTRNHEPSYLWNRQGGGML